jgi:hypothetical protein
MLSGQIKTALAICLALLSPRSVSLFGRFSVGKAEQSGLTPLLN